MNYGELKSLINSYLEVDETTFNSNVGQFVRQAEETICRQVQLPDFIQNSTSACLPGNQLLPLPSDYLSTYYLSVIDDGMHHLLLSKDQSYIREVYPDITATGRPRYFALFSEDALILGPTPDQSYTVEMSYFFFPPSITEGDDTTTTWLSINAENALLYGSLIQGYTYLKGDQDVIKQYTDLFKEAISELKTIGEGRDRKDSYRNSDRRIPV